MIKDHLAETLELFKSGYNCAQSVLAAFCEDYNLPRETAFRIASPFGGNKRGNVCGAITGAMMVAGLKYGTSSSNDPETKQLILEKINQLKIAFKETHDTTICNELLGVADSELNTQALIIERPQLLKTCSGFLKTVVIYLEEEL